MIGKNEIFNNELFNKSVNISRDWSQFAGLAFAFDFEAKFERDLERQWLYDNWWVALYISLIYVLCVICGQYLMSKRSAFSLRYLLAFWNTCLALFSIMGTIRCLPEFVSVIHSNGMQSSYCSSSYYFDVRLTFWYWIFVWSKVMELGDTAFIILRKQKLIVLHWMHHVLTLTYAFYVIGEAPASARWMVNMNFAIHSLMYTYYALKALQFRISRSIAMTITISQIMQMIFGLYININAFYILWIGEKCDTSLSASMSGILIYSLFFFLFIQFFRKSYGSIFTLKYFKRLLKGAAKDVLNKVD